jgi:hypothetical protein
VQQTGVAADVDDAVIAALAHQLDAGDRPRAQEGEQARPVVGLAVVEAQAQGRAGGRGVLAAQLGGGAREAGAERRVEAAHAGEAAGVGELGEAEAGVVEQLLGEREAAGLGELDGRDAEAGLGGAAGGDGR